MIRRTMLLAILVSSGISALAQQPPCETCQGPIYQLKELSKPAVLTSRPMPQLTEEAMAHGWRGHVIVTAVLCRSGSVTDIRAQKVLPFGMTDRVIKAVSEMSFTPAKKDGQAASQSMVFDFGFSYLGERKPLAKEPLDGRIIELVEWVFGQKSVDPAAAEIMKSLLFRHYQKEMFEHTWQDLLKLGLFDPQTSSFRIEEGDRGLDIFFDLKPRP